MIHWKKTFTFLLLSLLCLAATHIIYQKYGIVTSSTTNKEVVGFFSEINNDVFRKFNDRLLWVEGKSGDSLFENEAIKTNKKSSSKINLKNGSSIVLEENSMIILNQESNNLSLNILDGKILLQAKNKESFKVKSGDKLIDVKEATVLLSKNKEESSIQVIEGEVSSENMTIKSGESLEINKESTAIKKNLFSNFSPKQENSNLISLNQETVVFSWDKTNKNPTSFYIGTSPDNLTSQVISINKISKELKIGKYYWKVTDSSSEESPLFVIDIKPAIVAIPTYPKNIVLFNNPYTVEFKHSISDTSIIAVEYSQDSDFKSFKSLNKISPISLSKGTYYWRIKQALKKNVFYSNIESFQVEDKPKDVEISFLNEQFDLWYIEKPSLEVKWDSTFVQYVNRWKVETIQNNNMSNFFSSEKSTTLNLTYDAPLTVKVYALDKYDNVLGSKEKTFKFTKAPSPINPQLKDKYIAERSGTFSFNEKQNYESCLLTIKNKNYEKSEDCLNQSVFKDLMPGTYSVSIEVIDKFNRKLNNRSPSSLIVPSESAVTPPKMKKVKVE